MNIFSAFEQRVGALFEQNTRIASIPLSFKKVARQAIKKMKKEALVVNGRRTAPGLYTILVNAQDDASMRALYPQIAQEAKMLLLAKAQEEGLEFVGEPLVRFMVDPSVKSKKFMVFAENVTSNDLARLHKEEEEFLNGSCVVGGAVNNAHAQGVSSEFVVEQPPFDPQASDAGLSIIPENLSAHNSEPHIPSLMDIPEVSPAPLSPPTIKRPSVHDIHSTQHNNPVQSNAPRCLLIDRVTSATYTIQSSPTLIGRSKTPGAICLTDSNISRKHAQFEYAQGAWEIIDLGSTNGTQINGVTVNRCILQNGDTITLGLTNLEFKEN